MNRSTKLCIVVALTVVSAIALGGCGSAASRKARAVEKGQTFLDAGNFEKARVEFRNALQAAPNDSKVRYLNGVVLQRMGNLREAAGFFQGAIDVNADEVPARASLARLYLFSGAPQKSLDLVRAGLEKHPDDVSLLVVRAASRAQLRDTVGAFEDAEKAYRVDPKDEDAAAVLAGLYNANARSDRAQQVLEASVAGHPKSTDLRLALAQLYLSLKQDGKAEALLRENIKLKPDDAAHRIRLAQFVSVHSDDAAAEAVLRDAVKALPRDKTMKAALVNFLLAKKGPSAAEIELTSMIAGADRGDYAAHLRLAQLYTADKDVAKAASIYQGIIDKEGTKAPGVDARNRLATLKAMNGDVPAAEKLLSEVLEVSPHDADALVLKGNLELSKGDAKGAIVDLRAALRDQPNSAPILRVLANAHMRNGEPALAEETLRRAVDANPSEPGARSDLARMLIASGHPEQAGPILQQLVKEHPNDVPALEQLFRASGAAKDIVTARAAANGILATDAKSPLGHFFLGLLAADAGDVNEAMREYDLALQVQPDAAEPLQYMTRLLVTHKRVPDALRRLDQAAAAAPKSALPLTLKAEVLIAEKRYAESSTTLKEATARAPAWWVPYQLMATQARAQGDTGRAISILTEAIPKVSEPNRVRSLISGIQDSQGHHDEAIQQYEDALKAAPSDPEIKNNLAMLLATYKTDDASLKHAEDLAKDFASSSDGSLLDTLGWVKLKRGDSKSALALLDRAHSLAPKMADIQYHLAVAQITAGQSQAGIDNLRQVVASGQSFQGLADAKGMLDKLSTKQ